MGKFINEPSKYGYVERYFMSREDAERVKETAENSSMRDAAAQIISLMDEIAAAAQPSATREETSK